MCPPHWWGLLHSWFQVDSLTSDFHTYGMVWGPEGLYTYLDKPEDRVLVVNFTEMCARHPPTSPEHHSQQLSSVVQRPVA